MPVATFADRLQMLMEKKELTQADLSRKCGLSRATLSRYLKGQFEAKQDSIYKIARATDVSEAWLMGADVPMERVKETTTTQGPGIGSVLDLTLGEWRQANQKLKDRLLEIAKAPSNASRLYCESMKNAVQEAMNAIKSEIDVEDEKSVDEELSLIALFNTLNPTGRDEALKRVDELSRLDEYKLQEKPSEEG